MLFDYRLTGACLVTTYWLFLGYVRHRQWWTLRFALSRTIRVWPALLLSSVFYAATVRDLIIGFESQWSSIRLLVAFVTIAFVVVLFRFCLPLFEDEVYFNLRWKAWTGPSRTGITPQLTRYIGNVEDWRSLNLTCIDRADHPVEFLCKLAGLAPKLITSDPTVLLKARMRLDEAQDTIWVPLSQVKSGVYAPSDNGGSVSLLWGRQQGFAPRCSRGIIALPDNLLDSHPKLKSGIAGAALTLAHGILARNKGLRPNRLLCNLSTSDRIRIFEENSSLWPRPAKTLRSFYQTEMHKAFHGLGESFVFAAAELALLIADSRPEVLADWLDGQLEHQDLALNLTIARVNASHEDLELLYTGQYIAMLISLSEHRMGNRLRPELLVFRAVYRARDPLATDLPQWLENGGMIARLGEETEYYRLQGEQMIQALV